MDICNLSNSHRCGMTKKDAVTKLTMLKLEYGYNKIPVTSDIAVKDFDKIEAVAKLAKAAYLIYASDYVHDDEGINITVDRGYVMSSKAIDLLKEKAK
jgi:hypothetical protein